MPKLFYEVFLVIVIALILTIVKPFSPMGPDAQLYYGLGQNILSGVGYVDTIRNDEILPSVGYPALVSIFLLLGLTSGIITGKILLFLSSIATYAACRYMRFNIPVSLIAVAILSWAIPQPEAWSVEPALALSVSFFCFGMILFLRQQSVYNALLLAFTTFVCIMMRPLLLPLLFLSFLPALFLAFRFVHTRRGIITFIVSVLILLGSVGFISNHFYHDNRMISGTYSGIPLYCAFNDYIPLTGTYYSGLWDNLPANTRAEALDPLILKNGWQARDKALKSASLHFIISHPVKAAEGYLWRFGRYSFLSVSVPYIPIFYSWFFLSAVFAYKLLFSDILLLKEKIVTIILFTFPVYIIALHSCFIYVGVRYYLIPVIFVFFSILYFLTSFHASAPSGKFKILFDKNE